MVEKLKICSQLDEAPTLGVADNMAGDVALISLKNDKVREGLAHVVDTIYTEASGGASSATISMSEEDESWRDSVSIIAQILKGLGFEILSTWRSGVVHLEITWADAIEQIVDSVTRRG